MKKQRVHINIKHVPMLVSIGLFIVMMIIARMFYPAIGKPQVFYNLLIDNTFLLAAATGVTIVIILGGIDLSTASIMALVTLLIATFTKIQLPLGISIFLALIIGTLFGVLNGLLIVYFKIQPFIATLCGMFLSRGIAFLISIDSVLITDPTFIKWSEIHIPLIGGFISLGVIIALILWGAMAFMMSYSRLGRYIYAIGGNEKSAMLMGIRVGHTRMIVYTLSAFCSAVGGLLLSLYMLSGYALHASGLEMNAIAGAVIGGTLMTGGVGYVFGTMFGVLTQGLIQVLIMFQGSLNDCWTRLVIGLLLFAFIATQRVIVKFRERHKTVRMTENVEIID